MTKGISIELPASASGSEVDWVMEKGLKERRPHRPKLDNARFVAWDGEGYTDDDGEHHYMLFGNSDGESVQGKSLDYRDCFPLLLDNSDGINVIYSGNYDIVMMVKHMPFIVRDRLFKGLPVKYDGYRMRYFRGKYLDLTHRATKRSTRLYDVFSNFQCSFVNACKEYLGDDETLQAMHQMKLKRDSFTYNDDSVDPYWRSEMDYLVRLMDTLRELFAEIGIKPLGWYGPGAIASAVLSKHKMQHFYKNPIPEHIVELAERAYYGGRFEHFKVGKLDQVYEYDIRSAYPTAIYNLPDFSTGITWEYEESPETVYRYGLYQVSWNVKVDPCVIGPLPWRDSQGRIFYPYKGFKSWYWGVEVQELCKTFPPEMYTLHAAWKPIREADTEPQHPFKWVADMYADRARMKAEDNPAQKALKLSLNSLYGKTAQSTGARQNKDGTWVKPKWHNVLWAGWVTAATRANLLKAVRKNQSRIVAFETDAVFTMKPLDVRVGARLGEWEQIDIEQILYIHSGVYYAMSNDGLWRLKSRGMEIDKTRPADYWMNIFAQLPETPIELSTTIRRFGTDIRQTEHFGNWFDYVTTTNIPNAFSKRMHHPKACLTCLSTDKRLWEDRGLAPSRKYSYADRFHTLIVPQGVLHSDENESTPYNFPWREDVDYEWPETRTGDAIEGSAEDNLTWT